MDRYKYTLKDSNNRYESTHLPSFRDLSEDIEYITIISRSADSLMSLANKYYKDISLWFIIAWFNNFSGYSIFLQPGTLVKIPRNYNVILEALKDVNR